MLIVDWAGSSVGRVFTFFWGMGLLGVVTSLALKKFNPQLVRGIIVV